MFVNYRSFRFTQRKGGNTLYRSFCWQARLEPARICHRRHITFCGYNTLTCHTGDIHPTKIAKPKNNQISLFLADSRSIRNIWQTQQGSLLGLLHITNTIQNNLTTNKIHTANGDIKIAFRKARPYASLPLFSFLWFSLPSWISQFVRDNHFFLFYPLPA